MRNLDLTLNARNVWALIAFWAVVFVVFSLLVGVDVDPATTQLIGV